MKLDTVKHAAMFICMNDLVIASACVMPLVDPRDARATTNKLNAMFSNWELDPWALGAWSREA